MRDAATALTYKLEKLNWDAWDLPFDFKGGNQATMEVGQVWLMTSTKYRDQYNNFKVTIQKILTSDVWVKFLEGPLKGSEKKVSSKSLKPLPKAKAEAGRTRGSLIMQLTLQSLSFDSDCVTAHAALKILAQFLSTVFWMWPFGDQSAGGQCETFCEPSQHLLALLDMHCPQCDCECVNVIRCLQRVSSDLRPKISAWVRRKRVFLENQEYG